MRILFAAGLLALATSSVVAQNTCATAVNVDVGVYTVPLVDGQEAPPLDCIYGNAFASSGEWYRYTATADTAVRVTTALPQNSADTRVHIFAGTCGALVCVAGDDDSGPSPIYSSIVTFNVEAGSSYYIVFDDYWGGNGFDFELALAEPIIPPAELISFTTAPLSTNGYVRAVLDMNNDGLDDVVAITTTNINLHHQLPGGGFAEQNIGTTPADNDPSWSLAAGDIDGNGWNDLMYGGGAGVTFMMANAEGTAFTESSFDEYIFCQRTNMVDLDNDGHLDAFTCHDVDANVAFMNDGSGNLTFEQGGYGETCGNYGSLFTDVDNDGDVDLFVAKCGCDPVDLLMLNNGDGTFTDVADELGFADEHQSWSSAWGDFDNDGDMDVLVGSSSSGYHKLMHNNGDGTFSDAIEGSGLENYDGQSIEWVTHDFDNNGHLDIYNGGDMLMNNGDGTYSVDVTVPPMGPIGDLNNDGYLDIAGGEQVHYNDGGTNNWLRVHTIGSFSNANGIGARIRVHTPAGSMLREVRSGDGFGYMSSLTAHFGLGTTATIDSVEVYWPSGMVDVVTDVVHNTTLVVNEGLFSGTPEAVVLPSMHLYPVPALDQLRIEAPTPLTGSVRIFSSTGHLVSEPTLVGNRIDVSALPTGVYLLEVDTPSGVFKHAFTKG